MTRFDDFITCAFPVPAIEPRLWLVLYAGISTRSRELIEALQLGTENFVSGSGRFEEPQPVKATVGSSVLFSPVLFRRRYRIANVSSNNFRQDLLGCQVEFNFRDFYFVLDSQDSGVM